MERLTYDFCIGGNHCWQVKGADNLECREVCERQGDDGCKTCPIAKAFDRLAAIEDILGDEYDLDRLRELAQADREGRCIILPDPQKTPVLRKGTPVWYVDNETGEIEPGKVFIASYKDGKLDSFSVDFECGDFDEFVGSALGNCFFGSKEQAEAALRREQE